MGELQLGKATAVESRHRRHHIGAVDLDHAGVERFLQSVEQLGQLPVPLDTDRLASTARWLLDRYPDRQSVAPCIKARMRVATALRAMLTEPG